MWVDLAVPARLASVLGVEDLAAAAAAGQLVLSHQAAVKSYQGGMKHPRKKMLFGYQARWY